jgi:hypothetical protein
MAVLSAFFSLMGRFPTYLPAGYQKQKVGEKEEHTVHLLPSVEEILRVRKSNEAILGLDN